jgi:hypothetical protein
MSLKLLPTQLSELTFENGKAWITLPMPKGLREGAYVLDPLTTDSHGAPSFSFVRAGGELVRVPLAVIARQPTDSGNHLPDELWYFLYGVNYAAKLVQMRNWPQWPDEVLFVHVVDDKDNKLVVGAIAFV